LRALTDRLGDDKHPRLKALVQGRSTNLNQMIGYLTTLMMPGIDAEARFLLRAAWGADKEQRGLGLLAKAQLLVKGGQGKEMDIQTQQENNTDTEGGTETTFAT